MSFSTKETFYRTTGCGDTPPKVAAETAVVTFKTPCTPLSSKCVQKRSRIATPRSKQKVCSLDRSYRTPSGGKGIQSCIYKSSSLDNLTPDHYADDRVIKRQRQVLTREITISPAEEYPRSDDQQTLAARRIFVTLVLNAWRRKRLENRRMHSELKHHESEISSLTRQTSVLRSLLESEKNRVKASSQAVQQMTIQVEEANKQADALRSEKQELEKTVDRLEEQLIQLQVRYGNLKNELIDARANADSFEAQLKKEREKLCKLREDKKVLQSKADISLQKAASDLDIVQRRSSDLTQRLAEATATCASLEDSHIATTRALSELEERHQAVLAELETARSTAVRLGGSLEEREAAMLELRRVVAEQQLDLQDLRAKLRDVHQQQSTWTGRFRRLASSIIPISVIQIMTLVLMPYSTTH